MPAIRIAVLAVALAIVLCACLYLFPAQPAIPPVTIPQPDFHVKLAAKVMSTEVAEADYPYVRFLSLYAVPEERLPAFTRVLRFWLHQLSFQRARGELRPVQGSGGRLFQIDLRDYRWNTAAFRAVAHRERVFTDYLMVNNKEAEYLRRLAGIGQDPKTLHVEVVLRADWLFRETYESARSTSYYDLLYARQRFPTRHVATGQGNREVTVYHPGGDFTWPTWSAQTPGMVVPRLAEGNYKVPAPAHYVSDEATVDFPKNKKDWEEAFGLADVNAFLKKQDLKVSHGAVVSGLTEDWQNGSIVSRNNRLLTFEMGPLGPSFQSFDVVKSTGNKDYLEQSPKLVEGVIEFDAQELLVGLPGGGQAAFLTDKRGNRLEVGDGAAVIGPDPRDRRVRNPGDCFVCHAASSGFIAPRNLVKDILDKGIDVKIYDREKYLDFKGFYLEWERKSRLYQDAYMDLVEQTTKDEAGKPMTGAELSAAIVSFRDWYDQPLDLAQAAREMGCTEVILKGLLVQAEPGGRAKMLLQGMPCPRPIWDEDLMPRLAKILSADRLGASK